MTKPTWAKILGVLMVIIGGCGGAQDLKLTKTMALMDLQQDIIEELDKNVEIELDSNSVDVLKTVMSNDSLIVSDSIISGETLADSFKKLTRIPPAVAERLVMHGYIGLPFSLLYILAGIGFLQFRKHVIKFAIGTIILCSAFALYQYLDIKDADLSSLFKAGLNFQTFFGVIVDAIILVVILISNKDYYTSADHQTEDYYDTA